MMIKEFEPLKNYTTFKLGGPARYFIECYTSDDVKNAIKFSVERGLPVLPLGAGSDVLIPDKGFDGVVVRTFYLRGFEIKGNKVSAMSGEPIPKMANTLADRGLSGFEYLVGVPGTIGGGVAKNAGAHGHDVSEILDKATIINFEGEILSLPARRLNLRYRDSDVLKYGIVVEATFNLTEESPKVIKERIREFVSYRESTQPWKEKTAGCMFKNPPGHYAGKLIEEAGLKGFRIGGVKVSEKHANFFENLGGTADDAIKLIEYVRERVYKVFKVELEVEIVVVT